MCVVQHTHTHTHTHTRAHRHTRAHSFGLDNSCFRCFAVIVSDFGVTKDTDTLGDCAQSESEVLDYEVGVCFASFIALAGDVCRLRLWSVSESELQLDYRGP